MTNKLPFICGVVVFILLYISEETLLFGTSDISSFRSIGKFIGFECIIPLAYLCWHYKKGVQPTLILVFAIMAFWLMISSVFLGGDFNVAMMEISLMMTSVLFVSLFDYSFFKKSIVQIIFFLSIFSLILFFFQHISYPLTQYLPKVNNFLGFRYNSIGIANLLDRPLYIRNMSIFREPGVYAFFLCMALYYELEREQKNLTVFFVLLLSVFTTYSTTGYICSFLLLLYYALHKELKKRYVIFFSLFILAFLFDEDVFSLVWNKVDEENGSFLSRLSSVYANLEMFWMNPLIGIGEYNASTMFGDVVSSIFGQIAKDNTNTFLLLFAAYGLFYGSICIWGWARLFYKEHGKSFIFVFFVFFLLLSSELLIHNVIFYIILFYGFLLGKKDLYECDGNKHP